jgi:hypothetical protein
MLHNQSRGVQIVETNPRLIREVLTDSNQQYGFLSFHYVEECMDVKQKH